MGPLPETERGIKFIVLIGDYFTKWTEAYATKDHKVETIAKLLVEEFIGRFQNSRSDPHRSRKRF